MLMDSDHWNRLQYLFHCACDLEEPERSRFVNDACAGDAALLGQLELLLSRQESAKTFIETPALELMGGVLARHALESGESLNLVGKTISHYRILQRLGAGGMGVVYKAVDNRLGRFAALKFLLRVENLWPGAATAKDGAWQDFEADRILREARVASALDHPNICTIYEVGEYQGAPFIAMQFLAGHPLSEEIQGSPTSLERLLEVGIQVAGALDTAHKAGILHRDIKPANIFIVAESGQPKILDFGLARFLPGPQSSLSDTEKWLISADKGTRDDRPAEATTALGTLAYLSPEQVRRQELDARSDLFSFGVTLYQIATGRLPFTGDTADEILDSILHGSPAAPSSLNPRIPRRLDEILTKATAKEPASRYQCVQALADDLRNLQGSRRTFAARWRIAAIVVVLLASIIAFLHYSHRPSQRLTASDSIMLADFSNSTGDHLLDESLKQALRVQLEQSPFLHVISDQRAGQELKLMRQPVGTPLAGQIAREVCLRSGSKALVVGSVSPVGTHYALNVNVLTCATGESLASSQSEADSREKILGKLTAMAKSLREKLGESLAAVKKYDTSIEQATTPSLEALQNYSFALRTWYEKGEEASLPFFLRATELDPDFSMAWARLGTAYFNIGLDTKAIEALTKAYAGREKVSEPERFYIDSRYYEVVTREYDKGLEVDELWRQLYPRDTSPYLGAAGGYAMTGQHAKALEVESQALQLDPSNAFVYSNMAFIYINLNQFDRAREMLEEAQKRNLYNPWFESVRYQLGFLNRDPKQMQQAVGAVASRPALASFFLALQADTEAYSGHLMKARELTRRAMESARLNKDEDGRDGYELAGILREAEFGNQQLARQKAQALLKRKLAEQSRVLLALALARSGDNRTALSVVNYLHHTFPADTLLNTYWLPTIRAAVELNRHAPSEAIRLLERVIPYEMGLQPNPTFLVPYPPFLRGLAYLQQRRGKDAVTEFQKIADHSGLVLNCPLGALALLELGRAFAPAASFAINTHNRPGRGAVMPQPEAGREARKSYQEFLQRWKSADINIPILQQAKAEWRKME
jgi:eukaryotic-like serine/threonine-protein kinase